MAERLNERQLTEFAKQVGAQNFEDLTRPSRDLTESASRAAWLDRIVLSTVEETLVDARSLTDSELRTSIQALQREAEEKRVEYERVLGALNASRLAAGEIKAFELPSRRMVAYKDPDQVTADYGTDFEFTFHGFRASGTGDWI